MDSGDKKKIPERVRGGAPFPEEFTEHGGVGVLGPCGGDSMCAESEWWRTPEAHVRYLGLCAGRWVQRGDPETGRLMRRRAAELKAEWGLGRETRQLLTASDGLDVICVTLEVVAETPEAAVRAVRDLDCGRGWEKDIAVEGAERGAGIRRITVSFDPRGLTVEDHLLRLEPLKEGE